MLKEETLTIDLLHLHGAEDKGSKKNVQYGEYTSAGRGAGCFLLLHLDLDLKVMACVSHWPWSWAESFYYLACFVHIQY